MAVGMPAGIPVGKLIVAEGKPVLAGMLALPPAGGVPPEDMLTPLLPKSHHIRPTGASTSSGISGEDPSRGSPEGLPPSCGLPGDPSSGLPEVLSPELSPPSCPRIPTETRLNDMSRSIRATSNASAIVASLTMPFNAVTPQ
jgi:hypothetical protein